MIPSRIRWIMVYQGLAGLCDSLTGLLLVFAPAWTFSLMRLRIEPTPIAFARFIGIFVMCIGLTYLWALAAWPLRLGFNARWQAQWWVTAFVRSGVALLLGLQVATGAMEHGWLAVILTDATLASIQWTGLARGWLDAR